MATPRRSYGTGSLYVYTGTTGQKSWYGRWYSGGKRMRRTIGPKREAGSRDGLTRTEAEAELRRLTQDTRAAQNRTSPSLSEVGPEDVENLMATMQEAGKAAKTRRNALVPLHQLFDFAKRRGWCAANPCAQVDRPQVESSLDIRFLNKAELEALLDAVDVAREPFGHIDRAMFMTAAMTGMRQGELLALRWRDVDWRAERIRVRRNYVRGYWGTPKSRRGFRSAPLGTRLRTAKGRERHSRRCVLVRTHPDHQARAPSGANHLWLSPLTRAIRS